MPPAPTLQDALLPFQREGVAAAVERWDGRILLGDEMGLGKTIQVSNQRPTEHAAHASAVYRPRPRPSPPPRPL
eukprot:scaffold54877_cov67-Phaeocystis_antarctica.AAC.2